MVQVIVEHHVADYDAWYPVFVEHGDVRRKHGATGHAVYRTIADPNDVVVVNQFATREGAEGFMTDPSLPDVMHRAGVDSAPRIWLVSEADVTSY